MLDGELWRLVTGHWTHGSLDHLLWDVLAFAALGYSLARRRPKAFAITVVLATATISAALLLLPHWQSYRGLSGIDSALYVALAIDLTRAGGGERRLGAALLFLFLLKVGYETISGSALFVDATPGRSVVAAAHLVGAATGAVAALAVRGRSRAVRR